MSKRLKMLGVAAIAAAMMAASAQAATVFDLTAGFAGEGAYTWPEPATMIVLGTVLLAALRGNRQA
jgi:hypothetical protein